MCTAGKRGAEDARDLDSDGIDVEILRMFAKMHIEGAGFLTQVEVENLAYGARRMTCSSSWTRST
jgi:hypothetical protein